MRIQIGHFFGAGLAGVGSLSSNGTGQVAFVYIEIIVLSLQSPINSDLYHLASPVAFGAGNSECEAIAVLRCTTINALGFAACATSARCVTDPIERRTGRTDAATTGICRVRTRKQQ